MLHLGQEIQIAECGAHRGQIGFGHQIAQRHSQSRADQSVKNTFCQQQPGNLFAILCCSRLILGMDAVLLVLFGELAIEEPERAAIGSLGHLAQGCSEGDG